MRSLATKRYGPLPTISVTWVNASVFASRSGMMTGMKAVNFDSAVGSSGNGFFSRKRIEVSSGALISSVAAISAWPNASRLPQRCRLATQSRPSTGVLSWNISPGRSLIVQVLPSASAAGALGHLR